MCGEIGVLGTHNAFAQGLSSLRSAFYSDRGLRARTAAGQCPAPTLDVRHSLAGDTADQKAVIGRAEVSCKFHWRWSRARSGGAAEIFWGEFVGQPAAARVPPRNWQGHQSKSGGGLICLRSRHGSGESQIKQGRGRARVAGER